MAQFCIMEQLVNLSKEVSYDYLTYALVTANRAIPSAIDGLKVSQRRIVQTGFDLGLNFNKPFKKVARWAGETSGTLHPHGDCSESIIHLANKAAFLHPLVDGHGNLGGHTTDGQRISDDRPAAGRYVEAKLSEFCEAVFDIPQNLLNTRPSYDGQKLEICYYVPAVPLALVNSAVGIGTGYACNTASYNLKNVAKAVKELINGYELKALKALGIPDSSAYCKLLKSEGLLSAIQDGRGTITMQGNWEVTRSANKRPLITISSLPDISAERLCTKAAEIAEEAQIVAVRDLSNGEGIKVEIELKAKADVDIAVALILTKAGLQSTYSINNTFVTDGIPRQYATLELLEAWLKARRSILDALHQSQLDAINAKQIKVSLLVDVCENFKTIASLFSNSDDLEADLAKKLGYTTEQIRLLMEFRLSQLRKLNKAALEAELAELANSAKTLEALLRSPVLRDDLIVSQVADIAKRFAKPVRTKLIDAEPAKPPAAPKPEQELSILDKMYLQAKKLNPPMSTRKVNCIVRDYNLKTKQFVNCKTLKEAWSLAISEHKRKHGA